MQEGMSNFEGQNENNHLDSEQKKLRIDEIRHELMQIERQILKFKIHPTATSAQEIEDLHSKQVELLAELQNLEDEK
jgi:hypothetical protein